MKKILLLTYVLTVALSDAQTVGTATKEDVDSLDIKIGQMIMIGIKNRTFVSPGDTLLEEIRSGKVGGVVLFEKNISPTDSKKTMQKLNSELQKHAAIPLFISIDEEGGKVHRMKEKYGFPSMPSAAYLGNTNNADSTLWYNRRLSKTLKEAGINLNYAPSVDLAVNPDNNVIVKRERSFSGDHATVSKHASLCVRAHHENQVKTVLKHFPGHGSSTADSHLGIVDVTDSWRFRELLPFYDIIDSGVADAVMTAHIINRNWDTTMLPATLSERVITGMLRNLMGFKGVVFSDDMQMHAISKNYGFEKALELAVNAGVDVLMFANNVSKTEPYVSASQMHAAIKYLVQQGRIPQSRIDESYRRIMALKNK